MDQGLHRSGAAPEGVGYVGFGHVDEEPQHERRPLPDAQVGQGVQQLATLGVHRFGDRSGLALTLHPPAAVPAVAAVDDDPPQVGGGLICPLPATVEADKGVLDQVLAASFEPVIRWASRTIGAYSRR